MGVGVRRIGVRCEVRSGSGARWEGEAYQAYREARRKVGYGSSSSLHKPSYDC